MGLPEAPSWLQLLRGDYASALRDGTCTGRQIQLRHFVGEKNFFRYSIISFLRTAIQSQS